MRIQAIRASETLYKAGDRSFAADWRALATDADTDVVIQAMLTLNVLKVPDAADDRQGSHGQPQCARRAVGRRSHPQFTRRHCRAVAAARR